MAPSLFRRAGYDLRPEPNLDGLGKAYMTFVVVWTLILVAGVACFVYLRDLTFIRMRNVALASSSTLLIHVYLVLASLVYPLNGIYPCVFEFWAMSTYFPIGVALFQAQNMQLLDLSCLQKQLILEPLRLKTTHGRGLRALRQRWSHMGLVSRTYVLTAVGVVCQTLAILIIFLMSRRFHPFGIMSSQGDAAHCRHGWEWFPSALWQAVWTYIVGPCVLYKIRHIHDIHRWKLQTMLAIICSLPGLPLVIAGMYSPAFAKVNMYWPPPMWFVPGLVMMEFTTIFFPLWEAYQARYHRKITLSALDEWEKSRSQDSSLSSDSLKKGSVHPSETSTERQQRRDMYSMESLEKTLSRDAGELLQFAATKEFTGENIIFLTQVRDWKQAWREAQTSSGTIKQSAKRKLFNTAAKIYYGSICLHTAQFPVNIESKIYFKLEQIFRGEGIEVQRSEVTPFADDFSPLVVEEHTINCPVQRTLKRMKDGVKVTVEEALSDFSVPEGFDGAVFDMAERSVKYMVLTNTWIRFLDSSESSSFRSSGHGSRSSRALPGLLFWKR